MATPARAPSAPAAPSPAPSAARDDWAVSAADTIDRVITGIGDKTARPLTKLAAAVVFGLVAAVAGVALLVFLLTALVRVIHVYLPVHPYDRAVWVTYAGLGGILTLAGLFLWRKRRTKQA